MCLDKSGRYLTACHCADPWHVTRIVKRPDGSFANEIMHPSNHVTKTYRVTVRSMLTDKTVVKLSEGVVIDTGRTLPCTVTVLTNEPERAVMQMVIREGKNRQIRKMCEAVGLEVARLKRTAIGPVKLGMLKPGSYRELTSEEVRALRAAAQKRSNGGKR